MPDKYLVIVESPTKAKTIGQFLDKNYTVKSSYGHIRDLPKSKLGVDVDHDFTPEYEIPKNSKKTIAELKKSLKGKEAILATDEDREGEAIAWHLAYALKLDPKKSKRIVFHEITKNAINEALKNPREIDSNLVDAQQARRVLDRLVGYKLSPLLWKKIRYGLSAGRVQSIAVRLIVEREREIKAFTPDEYWTIEADLTKQNDKVAFTAKLAKRDGKVVPKLGIKNKKEAERISKDLEGATYKVQALKQTAKKRNPSPPFTTSTMQQEAAGKLGFSAKKTMFIAQQLYEGIKLNGKLVGLITYMRTDSVSLSAKVLPEAKEVITKLYGKSYALPKPRFYKTKSKSAQEAHEAIRPTELSYTPSEIKDKLTRDQHRLYNIIWKRTIACQMAEALFDATTAEIAAAQYLFRATGLQIKFDGFLKVYLDEAKDPNMIVKESVLPELKKDETLELQALNKNGHFTLPPPRYTEASLVKALEEHGIGRPSTYAPTMSTIVDRGYVTKEEKKFQPNDIGFLVNDLLVAHFPRIVDIKFTANMENDLDDIAAAKKEWVPIVSAFYKPFAANIKKKDKEINKKDLVEEPTKEKCEKCGSLMVIKLGRFGKFMACTKYPDCKNTKPLGEEKKLKEEYSDVKCDKCGSPMIVKRSKFGAFLGCSKYPDCKNIKPIVKSTGVPCPKCDQGEIVEKKSKKGRVFYACDKYPKCKYALWQKPTKETCPECKSPLVYGKEQKLLCSNKECNYTK